MQLRLETIINLSTFKISINSYWTVVKFGFPALFSVLVFYYWNVHFTDCGAKLSVEHKKLNIILPL